MFTVINVTII